MRFNPPSWIIGTWIEEEPSANGDLKGYKFTYTDVISFDTSSTHWRDNNRWQNSTIERQGDGGAINVTEEVSDSNYKINVTTPGGGIGGT